jgi:iron complex transport system permease protein
MRIALLIIGTLLAIIAALFIGPAPIGIGETLAALFGKGEESAVLIIQQIRAPRAALAAVIGAGLGASGAALQGYTRNPLADGGILGFSACAALGAVTALYFGFAAWTPLAALIGAGLGAIAILLLVGARKGAGTLILAGVGIGALATALTGLAMNFAPNPWALSEIVYWLMGSLREADLNGLAMAGPLTAIGIGALLFTGADLRALSLGEDTAISLGVSLRRVQILLIIGVALCIGSGVAVAGAIGFIGLFIPHIIRMIYGADPARLIWLSAIAGAGFLTLADMATRLLANGGAVLYLGILTSLIGVPFFLYLAVKAPSYE